MQEASASDALLSVQFLSYSWSFLEKTGQIIGWHPHLWSWGLRPLGNPGSATEFLLADIFIKTDTPTCLDGPFLKDDKIFISWSILWIWCWHCCHCAWTLRFIYTERKRTRKEIFLLSLSLLDVNNEFNFLWTHLEATLLSRSSALSVNGPVAGKMIILPKIAFVKLVLFVV